MTRGIAFFFLKNAEVVSNIFFENYRPGGIVTLDACRRMLCFFADMGQGTSGLFLILFDAPVHYLNHLLCFALTFVGFFFFCYFGYCICALYVCVKLWYGLTLNSVDEVEVFMAEQIFWVVWDETNERKV